MKIGVIGAGTMGSGIAQVFAGTDGFEVVLCDIEESYAERGKSNIAKSLARLVSKGKMEQSEMDAIVSKITTGLIDKTEDCDLIVEAAIENLEAKRNLFLSLQKICKPETIFSTNTSSLSITELAAGLDREVIGLHFFNPAPVMKLVEIIVGFNTSDELVEKIQKLCEQLGKTPIVAKDAPGFIVNRVLVPMINEAIGIFADGTASADSIDTAMKLGANHPMGPLALGDLIGLDVCLAIMEVLYSETGDPKYRAHTLLRKMVRGGALGKKTGKGFYQYA